ncbi:MAG TPA: hypothetical protein VNJ08_01855 [Bacteriovoracaceae bacterium]|nr:hypothetical protein [Bacteriovoracaceae bacterium]
MKKLNALLHDITVINFQLVGKLVGRYWKLSAVFGVILAVLIPYLYFGQIVMHQKSVNFKAFSNKFEANEKAALADLVEGAGTFLKKGEILAIVNTYEFTTSLARRLVDSPDFSKFDFRDPKNKSNSAQDSLVECPDKECQLKVLAGMLPALYTLDADFDSERFNLTVVSRSNITTFEVIRNFQITLESLRYNDTVSMLDKQIKQVNELIIKSRADIDEKGGFDKVASGELLDAMISQQQSKMRSISERLNKEIDQLRYEQIRLKESNLSAKTKIGESEKLSYEKYSKIQHSIDELRQNIASLNSIAASNRTATDEQVLNQLKLQLRKNEDLLRGMGDIKRGLAHEDSFIKTQISNSSSFQFDYKVASARVRALEEENNLASKELDRLYTKKAEMDNHLLQLKPDLEYLKLLEGKLVTMKMSRSAVTSDVTFENYGPEVQDFKRNTFLRIAIFSFLFLAFILFLSLILIYTFDDRIYDEFEIIKCCDDLPIIGNTPNFD